MSDSFASGMEAARGTYMLEIGEIIDNKYRILYEVGHGAVYTWRSTRRQEKSGR